MRTFKNYAAGLLISFFCTHAVFANNVAATVCGTVGFAVGAAHGIRSVAATLGATHDMNTFTGASNAVLKGAILIPPYSIAYGSLFGVSGSFACSLLALAFEGTTSNSSEESQPK